MIVTELLVANGALEEAALDHLAEEANAGVGAALGRAIGAANLALLPFGFGLPLAGGALRDGTGSYAGMILLCMGLVLVGMIFLARLGRKPS